MNYAGLKVFNDSLFWLFVDTNKRTAHIFVYADEIIEMTIPLESV